MEGENREVENSEVGGNVSLNKIATEEKLINFVFNHPHIYEKKSNAHHDAGLIQNSWQEIAATLNTTGKYTCHKILKSMDR